MNIDRVILEFISELRSDFLTGLFSLITHLGDGAVIILIIFILYWCIDKRLGLKIGLAVSLGGIVNGILKTLFAVPRPWDRFEGFEAVESAKARATGYSFPSGHTSNAVCTYGSAAVCLKGRAIKIVLSVIIISVAFSRLYLGVHTPSDVLVSLVAGAAIVFLSSRLYGRLIKADHRTFLLTAVSAVAVSAAAAVFIRFKPYGGGYEFELVKDGYLACGLLAGLFAGWYFERKYLDFSPSGGIIFQIVKTIAGLASSLLIMWLGGLAVDMLPCIREAVYVVRYALTSFWAVFVYPLIFTKFKERKCSKQ